MTPEFILHSWIGFFLLSSILYIIRTYWNRKKNFDFWFLMDLFLLGYYKNYDTILKKCLSVSQILRQRFNTEVYDKIS